MLLCLFFLQVLDVGGWIVFASSFVFVVVLFWFFVSFGLCCLIVFRVAGVFFVFRFDCFFFSLGFCLVFCLLVFFFLSSCV